MYKSYLMHRKSGMKQKGKDISENMLDLRVMYQNAGGYKQFLKEHDADHS